MDTTTRHIKSCNALVPHFLNDYLASKASFFEQHRLGEEEINLLIAWEKEKALDGTNRHELMFEYAVHYALANSEHTSGAGKDIVHNGSLFFYNLELKTGSTAWNKGRTRNRLEIDLSEAKDDSTHIVIAAYSEEADECLFGVIPTDKCRTKGKLNGSVNPEFDKQGKISSKTYKDDFFPSYAEMIEYLKGLA